MEIKDVITKFAKEISSSTGIKELKIREVAKKTSDAKARIIKMEYKNRYIHLLDLSSGFPTGTFKDYLACCTVAYCLEGGNNNKKINNFVTRSSGNNANAMAYYAQKNNIGITIFCPKKSRYKLHNGFSKNVQIIEIDAEEKDIAEIAAIFGKTEKGRKFLPLSNMAAQAHTVIAYILDYYLKGKNYIFDYHAQSISSGHGIFGFYEGFKKINHENEKNPPRVIMVQQKAICPHYEIFLKDSNIFSIDKIDYYKKKAKDMTHKPDYTNIIEHTLFCSKLQPYIVEETAKVLNASKGNICRISKKEFMDPESIGQKAVNLLTENDIILYKNKDGDILEKSGVIALAGVIKNIDEGIIDTGRNISCIFTGGAKDLRKDEENQNFISISSSQLQKYMPIKDWGNTRVERIKKFKELGIWDTRPQIK